MSRTSNRGWLARLWTRLWLRNVSFRSRYGNLQRLYALEDPWDLKNPKEQRRFERCNALIISHAPGCRTLLEIGCGEGRQTEWLQRVAPQVTGIEVSETALRRARERCPDAEFHEGRLEDVPDLMAGRRFDVVTAFEVLYYVNDVAVAIRLLQAVTDLLIVTNYEHRAQAMAHHFDAEGWTRLDDIEADGTTWEVQLWRRQLPSCVDQ